MRADEAGAYASRARAEEEARRNGAGSGAQAGTAAAGRTKPEALRLMEAMVERSNMQCAYERVVKNEGAPGVDGLRVAEFKPWLQAHWPSVRQGARWRYRSHKAVRTLGIPTVLDV